MSANRFFLGGTDLVDITLARADERDALATYASLIEDVKGRCGPEVAALFAEPVRGVNRSTGQPNVAWYCSREGTAFPLRQVEGAARVQVVEMLRQRLRAFAALSSDPQNGAVFGSWLYLLGEDSIICVAGQPVIRDWGMLPSAAAASAQARESCFRGALGQYLPSLPLPPFTAVEAQAFAGAIGREERRDAARTASATPQLAMAPVAGQAGRRFAAAPGWLAPVIATAAAAIVYATLSFGHVLRYPYQTLGPGADAIEAQRQTNEALRMRLARLRGGKEPLACRVEGNGSTLLPSPERTMVETRDGAGRQPAPKSLSDLLERATVLVLTDNGLGSGFFVSDRHIVTNHHVVGDAGAVRVASRALGGVVSARVVAVGNGAERGTQDIAVLEVEPKPGSIALSLGVAPGRLDAVTASGYPGAVLETINGSTSSGLPEANFTQGIVTSHQLQQPGSIATIIHTAQIGHGNSGGPLVDAGGCAVGINSWLSPDAMGDVVFSTYFQALDASELRQFLRAHDIGFAAAETACRPVTAEAPRRSAGTP